MTEQAEQAQYVSINGEISAGVFEWAHHPKSVWYQVIPLGAVGAGVLGMISALFAEAEEGSMVLWSIVGGLIGALLIGAISYYMAAARMELKKGVLRLSTGQKKVNVPLGAIAYIGAAEFTRGNKWRMSRLNFVVEPGPGIEIYSHDRKYLTVSTPRAEKVYEALLSQGMNPQALRVPFPSGVSAKPPAWREERDAARYH